jgi:hypothetical protein
MLPIVGALVLSVSFVLTGTEVSLLLNVSRDCKLGAIVVEDDVVLFDSEELLLLLLFVNKRRLYLFMRVEKRR